VTCRVTLPAAACAAQPACLSCILPVSVDRLVFLWPSESHLLGQHLTRHHGLRRFGYAGLPWTNFVSQADYGTISPPNDIVTNSPFAQMG